LVTVFIPTMLQPITGGVKQFDCEATNLRQVIERLDQLFPGIKDKLVEDGRIKPNLAVAIDGEVARMGLLEKVGENISQRRGTPKGHGPGSDFRE